MEILTLFRTAYNYILILCINIGFVYLIVKLICKMLYPHIQAAITKWKWDNSRQ